MPLVLAPLLLGFGVICGFLVLYGLSQTSQVHTGSSADAEQGGLVGWLKTALNMSIGGQILHLANKAIRSTVSHWAEAHLRAVAAWFGALSTLALGLFTGHGDLAEATDEALAHLTHVTIPRDAKKAAAPAKAQARAAHTAANHASAATRAQAHNLSKLRSHTDAQVRPLHRAVAVDLPQEIARVNRRAGTAAREIEHPDHGLLSRWAKWLWAAGIAGLVVRTLTRRFPWLFCRKVTTAGKLICGMDEGLFNSLLQDALAIAGTVSLLEFIDDAQKVETVALDALGVFIREMPKV